MFGSSATLLAKEASDEDLKRLCQVLWKLEYCDQCILGKACLTNRCAWSKSRRPETFLEFYKTIAWIPEALVNTNYALKDHQDLIGVVQLLKHNPTEPISVLMVRHFSASGENVLPGTTDQAAAFDLGIRVLTTIECSGRNRCSRSQDQSIQQLMEAVIPFGSPCSAMVGEQLNARDLRSIAGVEFLGTNDLSKHLSFDRKTGKLQIFHQTTVLKLYLSGTLDQEKPALTSFSM